MNSNSCPTSTSTLCELPAILSHPRKTYLAAPNSRLEPLGHRVLGTPIAEWGKAMRKSGHNCRPKVHDLFAGCGLFASGFAEVGFHITQSVELDPVAAQTHENNLGGTPQCADVRKSEPVGTCDVLIAGPPCQGFSTLGKQRSNDPRNQLALEVIRWARLSSPQIVVIENVDAFLSTPTHRACLRAFLKLGYETNCFTLDATHFGVAQLRRRSFTIASRVGLPAIPNGRQSCIRTVRSALDGLPLTPNNRNNHAAPKPSELALARMKVIPRGGDKRDVLKNAPHLAPPSWKATSSEVTDVWGRMVWDEPCNTLRTCLQNPSKGRYIHPERNRVITLREAARLHGVKDSWVFSGLPTQVARQIGNSVPPPMARAIARKILPCLR